MKLYKNKLLFIFIFIIFLHSCNKQSGLPPEIETETEITIAMVTTFPPETTTPIETTTVPPETTTTTTVETTTPPPETTTTTVETTTRPPETTTTRPPEMITTTAAPVTTIITNAAVPSTTIPLAAPVKPKLDEDAIFKGKTITGLKMPEAPGKSVATKGVGSIDYSNASEGYVMVKYDGKTSNTIALIIVAPTGNQYNILGLQESIYIPFTLSEGNGTYQIALGERLANGKFTTIVSAKFEAKFANDTVAFTYPNFYANYNGDSKSSKLAAHLVKDIKEDLKKIEAIYNYVITTYTYDYDLAAKTKNMLYYVPNLDDIISSKKGICFGYASLMVSMLRSVGIPAKHIHGYAPDGKGGEWYHAWINTFTKETGWVNAIIQFDGKNWRLMDPTYASTTNSSAEGYKIIGDGSKYKNAYTY